MIVNGIIAEYNPFHNGHKYQLETSRAQTKADYTIIVMSGDFVQRGAPALVSKYTRAEMALQCGADLVLELPAYFAAGSAEFFAAGAISLLDKLGTINYVCFGSEYGQTDAFEQIASILVEEPEKYKLLLREKLKAGLTYPAARAAALQEFDPNLTTYQDLLSQPNNILGIEYRKALLRRNSAIRLCTVKRLGAEYHSEDLETGNCFASAQALRNILITRQDITLLRDQMPAAAFDILYRALHTTEYPSSLNYVENDDFSALLHYKLLMEADTGFSRYVDVNEELSDRIRNHLGQYSSFSSFCERLKSKDMTYSRISRCLIHILLNITSENLTCYQTLDYVPYARILGFRKNAAPLLSAIKTNSSIPMISKLADASQILDENAMQMLKEDIRISHIYDSVLSAKTNRVMRNEYTTPIIIY